MKFGRRVFTHSLVIATTFVTCTAIRADHNDNDTAATSTSQTTSTSQHGDKTSHFLQKALKGGQMEVQMGQLAQQKAENQEVKQLGQTLVNDHRQANQQLEQLAAAHNVKAGADQHADKDASKHQKMFTKLQGQSGAEFDKAFVRMAIKDHKKDIAEFERARTDVTDPQVTSFIDQTLPKLRNHLQMAESAARAVGVDTASLASERDDDADTAAGAAAGSATGSSARSSDLNRDQDHLNGATESDASGTLNQNNPSATVKGNVGDHEFKADADVNNKSVDVDTSNGSRKIFQKGDGKVLGLSTDKSDGKFLGIIPDPKKKHSAEAEVNVNTDTGSSSVGSSAGSESSSSSSSSSK